MFSYSFSFIFHIFLSMGQDISHGSLHILSIDIFCLSSSFVYTTHRFFFFFFLIFFFFWLAKSKNEFHRCPLVSQRLKSLIPKRNLLFGMHCLKESLPFRKSSSSSIQTNSFVTLTLLNLSTI